MLDVYFSGKFRRDYKRIQKQGKDVNRLLKIVDILAAEQPLAPKYRDHVMTGDFIGHRECHIEPDWLLVYKVEQDALLLTLTRTGSHSDRFRK